MRGNAARFINKEAEDAYLVRRSKNLIPERGIEVSYSFCPEARGILEFYGWAPDERLVELIDSSQRFLSDVPETAAVEVVHEFYANLTGSKAQEGSVVKIRGKNVDFSAKTINDLYSLKVFEQRCWFNSQNLGEVDWDRVLTTVADPGTRWRLSRSGLPQTIMTTALRRDYRVLHYFISSRLIPGTHTSEVTRERALLLFGLIMRHPLDTGAIIRNSIVQSSRGEGTTGLALPSTITLLCLLQGVPILDEEVREDPKKAITRATVRQMQRGRVPRPLMIEGLPDEDSERDEEVPGAADQDYTAFGARLERIETSIVDLRAYQESQFAEMRAQQQAQYQYQQGQFDYMSGCFEAMFGAMSLQMPTRPPPPEFYMRTSPAAPEEHMEDDQVTQQQDHDDGAI